MPVRPRRSKRPAHALTLERDLALQLGPGPEESLEVLELLYRRHRTRYGPGSWGYERFENGVDIAAPEPEPVDWDAVPLDDTDAVLPGTPEYTARIFAEIHRAKSDAR